MADKPGSTAMGYKRKLIEVALPLETINREAAREKSIRHGHPSTLHLWWARRPLAAARAVLFAQLVDDPSSHPDRFPTEELQRKERERLHNIIKDLVVWENVRDRELLSCAHHEILESTDGRPPVILDPFAGGGTIPLEAQRLGLEARASDLNPVAVLINKALIELPSRFADRSPVFPGLNGSQILRWEGTDALAGDVRAYGEWMRAEAERRLGQNYPLAQLPDGTKTKVIAWIWARTVTCPNPACMIEMPLVRSWWLGKKKGKETYVVPTVIEDATSPSGKHVEFLIGTGRGGPTGDNDGTVGRLGARCIACNTSVSLDYIRSEGRQHRMKAKLMAIAAEGRRQRIYLPPTDAHARAADVPAPAEVPAGELSTHPQYMAVPRYGMLTTADLFTNRQASLLMTLSDLVMEARERAIADGGDVEYANAIATYLAFSVSRTLNKSSAICGWDSSTKVEGVRGVFARQAVSMVWDFAEANPFAGAAGDPAEDLNWVAKVIEFLVPGVPGKVAQADASRCSVSGVLISTDPPYYDNVPYADLSDFFYVWLRRSLKNIYPDILGTMLVPKAAELVADYVRLGGKERAKTFFESGFSAFFARAREAASQDAPITVFYAFRQSETDGDGSASTGWETLLEGMIRSGWIITATWPMRSEMGNRLRGMGSNALASSIVLSLRPRLDASRTVDRRGFVTALERELPTALRQLQHGQIAPVDLPQAAIGPGMAIFSSYASVIEADGSPMTIRSALARINEVLDHVLSEQEGDFDSATRFAIAWYRHHGYETGRFGDADNIARARNTSVEAMERDGILIGRAGKTTLLRPSEMPSDYDVETDAHVSTWEVLHHLIRIVESDGIAAGGRFLGQARDRAVGAIDIDLVKELAYLLFSVAEKNGWTKDALSFNMLATAWTEILDASRLPKESAAQSVFEFDGDE